MTGGGKPGRPPHLPQILVYSGDARGGGCRQMPPLANAWQYQPRFMEESHNVPMTAWPKYKLDLRCRERAAYRVAAKHLHLWIRCGESSFSLWHKDEFRRERDTINCHSLSLAGSHEHIIAGGPVSFLICLCRMCDFCIHSPHWDQRTGPTGKWCRDLLSILNDHLLNKGHELGESMEILLSRHGISVCANICLACPNRKTRGIHFPACNFAQHQN